MGAGKKEVSRKLGNARKGLNRRKFPQETRASGGKTNHEKSGAEKMTHVLNNHFREGRKVPYQQAKRKMEQRNPDARRPRVTIPARGEKGGGTPPALGEPRWKKKDGRRQPRVRSPTPDEAYLSGEAQQRGRLQSAGKRKREGYTCRGEQSRKSEQETYLRGNE